MWLTSYIPLGLNECLQVSFGYYRMSAERTSIFRSWNKTWRVGKRGSRSKTFQSNVICCPNLDTVNDVIDAPSQTNTSYLLRPFTFSSFYSTPLSKTHPNDNCSKLLGISKNEQNHLLYSVSCLINKGLRIVYCSVFEQDVSCSILFLFTVRLTITKRWPRHRCQD